MQSIPAQMMSLLVRLGAVALIVALGGCASLSLSCQDPARSMATAEIFFGRKIGNATLVSNAAFAQFVADEVTPRFPDGLTVIDGNGQWRDGRGILLREPSKVVLLAFHDDPVKQRGLVEIADAYKRKFHQQSVLTTVRAACVSF
jgi:Protein of unknown function (DUF3574)